MTVWHDVFPFYLSYLCLNRSIILSLPAPPASQTWIRTDPVSRPLREPEAPCWSNAQTMFVLTLMMRYDLSHKHSITGSFPNTWDSQMYDIFTYLTNAASDALFQTHIDHIARESFRPWILFKILQLDLQSCASLNCWAHVC